MIGWTTYPGFPGRLLLPLVPGPARQRPVRGPSVPAARLRSGKPRAAPGPFASFVRFVVCGGGVTLLSATALVVLQGRMDLLLANALVTVAGTLLATELHGRISFRSGRRGWRVHLESAATAAGAWTITSAAMLALHHAVPHPAVLLDQAVYVVASGFAGLARFFLLRLVVFGSRRDGTPSDDVVLAA